MTTAPLTRKQSAGVFYVAGLGYGLLLGGIAEHGYTYGLLVAATGLVVHYVLGCEWRRL